MQYIIMCGGNYPKWDTPRQLLKIKGESIVARTIRLLRENGVDDIAISSNNDVFKRFGVPVLKHDNDYTGYNYDDYGGYWCNAFYPTDYPVCYLFGDVVYSKAAIQKIIDTETDDIIFFGSAPPFTVHYPKPWVEPFGFKVVDTDHLKEAQRLVKEIDKAGRFYRSPIAWEMWNVISRGDCADPNTIYTDSYVVINDFTCDVDNPDEKSLLQRLETEIDFFETTPLFE